VEDDDDDVDEERAPAPHVQHRPSRPVRPQQRRCLGSSSSISSRHTRLRSSEGLRAAHRALQGRGFALGGALSTGGCTLRLRGGREGEVCKL